MNQQIILSGLSREDLLSDIRHVVNEVVSTLPKPEKVKEYLSLQETCQLTGFSKSLIYQLTSARKIPHLKKGGRLLFNRRELTEWLEASAQPMTA